MDARYWLRALRADARHAVRTPGFIRDVATAGLKADCAPKAPLRELHVAYPDVADLVVDLGRVSYRLSNLDPMERFVVAALATLKRPRRILEIGTYDGATTLLLARAAPDAQILTLDLDETLAGRATVAHEAENAQAGVGAQFRDRTESGRITQLYGDSRTFDFNPWCAQVDFILIDGGHEYETVRSDTASAMQMLAPGGTIVWDDYTPGWPGVVRAVDESNVSIVTITGTDLAVYDTSWLT